MTKQAKWLATWSLFNFNYAQRLHLCILSTPTIAIFIVQKHTYTQSHMPHSHTYTHYTHTLAHLRTHTCTYIHTPPPHTSTLHTHLKEVLCELMQLIIHMCPHLLQFRILLLESRHFLQTKMKYQRKPLNGLQPPVFQSW